MRTKHELMSTLQDIRSQIGLVSGQDFPANEDSIRLDSAAPIAAARVHEVTGSLRTSLALAVIAKSTGRIFWVAIGGRSRSLRARGLRPYGDPAHLILVETANRDETLWAAEQALRCRGAGAVIIDIDKGPDLSESRRLQIAAQVGGGIGLVLIRRHAQSSACQTRWHCESEEGSEYDWVWSLTRNKRGRPRAWSVRGDPPEHLVHPPDLCPSLENPPIHAPIRFTTHPRSLVSGAAA